MSKSFNPCEWLSSYIAEELPPQQQLIFEAHLPLCESCREELEVWNQVGEGLPYTMELIEPPAELKGEVMEAIFGPNVAAESNNKPARIFRLTTASSRLRRWGLASAAVLVLLTGALFSWNVRKPAAPQPNVARIPEPATVQQELALRTFDASNPKGEGKVWMTRQGDRIQVVLQVKGLPETRGDEAYQMWMVKGEKRYNCGTFKVDQSGNGVLVYPLTYAVQFDSIGITLEPDANGTLPRGKKVLGS